MTVDARKQYVISLTSLNNSPVELIGLLAKDMEKVQKLSINIPLGFVITTNAFDDFLIANDLLEFISPRINDINYEDEKSVKKASEEIQRAIQDGVLPDIIGAPVFQAYSGLSGFYDAYVALKQSPINSTLDEKTFTETKIFTNVTGRETLAEKIKEAWGQLFTIEALKHRAGSGYEGYVTQAIIVQKMLQAEVNGKLYSYNSYDGDKTQVEILAFFGLNDPELWKNMVPDNYLVNKKTQEILEKKIIGQEYMFARKGRTADKNPIIKVPISKLWHKKQKMDDRFILSLFRQCVILEENFNEQIEVSWEFEAGKIYIVDFDISHTQSVAHQDDLPVLKPETKKEGAPVNQKFERKSMDEYVDEVGSIRQNYSTVGSSKGGEEVVVDIKPVEELHIIAQGSAKGEKLVFGLVHLVFTETDYDGLTGDEILIVKNISPDYYDVLNSVKGLVVQADVDSSELLDIKVPVIHNIPDAFDLFQENDVVTLRPWNACVYLGAGKETEESKNEVPKYAHPVEPESGIKDNNIQEQTNVVEVKEKNVEKNVKTNVEKDSGDIIFDAKTAKLPPLEEKAVETKDTKITNELPKTVLDFWQAYYPGKTTEKPDSVDGYVVRVADIIGKYDKKIFIGELSAKLIQILDQANGKPVILVSAGRDTMQEELVEAELGAIGEMRNKDYLRNLWYSLDNIVDVDDLVKLKKLITSKGFRRSSSFKLLLAVHAPQSLIVLKGLLDSSVDGVIIDMDLMFREHGVKVKHNDPHMVEYISHKIAKISEAKTLSMILSYENQMEVESLKSFIKAGLNAIILDPAQIASLKPVVAELESAVKVERKKKRGRKRKEIDFGY